MTNQKIESDTEKSLPTPEHLCLHIPLYKRFKLRSEHAEWLTNLEDYRGALDIYCCECRSHTVFSGSRFPPMRLTRRAENQLVTVNRNFTLEFSCPRSSEHVAIFVFRVNNGILEKIGQSPSISEIAAPDLQVYRSILGDERLSELSRGIGLATHGVGAGALLYLRRIFESLIQETKIKAMKEGHTNEVLEKKAHMDEQILSLRGCLPDFLVENRSAYGIMSHGIHSLSEDECLNIFPLIRTSIELILDEILEKNNKEKKISNARNEIAKLSGILKSKNS